MITDNELVIRSGFLQFSKRYESNVYGKQFIKYHRIQVSYHLHDSALFYIPLTKKIIYHQSQLSHHTAVVE